MCGRGEGAAGDLGEESGCGPDTDSGHTGQDRVKRVSKNSLFYRKRHLVSLLTQRDELGARRGSTTAAAFVPGTTTVCSASA